MRLALFMLVDIIRSMHVKKSQNIRRTSVMQQLLWIGFSAAVALIFCSSMLAGRTFFGGDTIFHINRIYAYAQALKHGDLFPRIFYGQNFGFGYGSPMFYSVVFLLPAACLNLMGCSLEYCYVFTMFLCIGTAAYSMIRCTAVMTKNHTAPYLAAAFYVFTVFNIVSVYKKGSIGENLAQIFIPWCLLSIYEIIFLRRRKWKLLGISFACVLLSHNISFILMSILFACLLVINWRRLHQDMLIQVGLGVLAGASLCAFFLLPMLEQLSAQNLIISDMFNQSDFVGNALPIAELFNFSVQREALSYSPGFFCLFLPLLNLRPSIGKRPLTVFLKQMTWLGYFLLFAATNLFPWKWFLFLSFIQFPGRLLLIAVPMLAISAAIGLARFCKARFVHYGTVISSLTLAAALLFAFGQTSYFRGMYDNLQTISAEDTITSINNIQSSLTAVSNYSYPELVGAEYLQKEHWGGFQTDQNVYVNGSSSDVTYERAYNRLTFTLASLQSGDVVRAPLTWYKGYTVEIRQNGKTIGHYDTLPETGSGLVSFTSKSVLENVEIVFHYQWTILQILAWLISVFTLLLLIFISAVQRKRYRRIQNRG